MPPSPCSALWKQKLVIEYPQQTRVVPLLNSSVIDAKSPFRERIWMAILISKLRKDASEYFAKWSRAVSCLKEF